MRKISALLAGLVLASTLALTVAATGASANHDPHPTFGNCVKNGLVQPGRNGSGVLGDGHYGPYNNKDHGWWVNDNPPFDFGVGCFVP
jgi:hypothetical protein